MVKVILDLLQFLLSCAPLLTATAFFGLLSVWLSWSIKKHSKVYYFILAIPFALVAVPTVMRWCGVPVMSFTAIPVLGQIVRDYIHMGTFGHPLLIIIMYMGALDPKIGFVKRLMSIRKELSIICGFPVLTHSLIRVANTFPNALKFFFDNESYMTTARVSSELGAGISNFSFVLGILMLALFLPLWITSFDSVHKRMGTAKWKKFQKWAYVLYAFLFIHAMGIEIGGILNPRGGSAQKPAVGVSAQSAVHSNRSEGEGSVMAEKSDRNGQTALADTGTTLTPPVVTSSAVVPAASSSRRQTKGFADIQVSAKIKQIINVGSLLLIYGSYLWLRLRKARRIKAKRQILRV